MRIGDAAAAAGTTPRTLRFYEQRGLLDPAPRTGTADLAERTTLAEWWGVLEPRA